MIATCRYQWYNHNSKNVTSLVYITLQPNCTTLESYVQTGLLFPEQSQISTIPSYSINSSRAITIDSSLIPVLNNYYLVSKLIALIIRHPTTSYMSKQRSRRCIFLGNIIILIALSGTNGNLLFRHLFQAVPKPFLGGHNELVRSRVDGEK